MPTRAPIRDTFSPGSEKSSPPGNIFRRRPHSCGGNPRHIDGERGRSMQTRRRQSGRGQLEGLEPRRLLSFTPFGHIGRDAGSDSVLADQNDVLQGVESLA